MGRKLTQEEFVQRAHETHGDKYDYSKAVYQGKDKKVLLICPEHGEFWQEANNHMRGQGCPECARLNRWSNMDDFVEKARDVHGLKYCYDDVDYVDSKTKVCIVCPEHGSFYQSPNAHLSGCGCPLCGNALRYEHIVETIKDKYGVDNLMKRPEFAERMANTCLERYGVRNPMQSVVVQARYRNTMSSLYGVEYPYQSSVLLERSKLTKDANHTHNASKPEDMLHKCLIDIFGNSFVKRHYFSSDYPFICDFYIESKNYLYIELNAMWTHNKRWFDASDMNCLRELDDMKAKALNSRYYSCAVDIWSVRDVLKRDIARQNKLNYLTFWKSDLSDFYEWVDAGCPDGQDWIREYSWKMQA